MFEREIKLYAMMLGYCKMLMADVEEAEMATQPSPGVNPPQWILGHLAICTDFALKRLDQPMALPKTWLRDFGPGSKPGACEAPPSKSELMTALAEGQARVTKALLETPQEVLERDHGIEFLKPGLTNVAEFLAHLMTTHTGIHLGQLSMWRHQMGKPGVLPI